MFDLAGKVINVLVSLIAEEVKLAFGVKTDIESLRNTVSTIQAVKVPKLNFKKSDF